MHQEAGLLPESCEADGADAEAGGRGRGAEPAVGVGTGACDGRHEEGGDEREAPGDPRGGSGVQAVALELLAQREPCGLERVAAGRGAIPSDRQRGGAVGACGSRSSSAVQERVRA
eukprot:scaffold7551_cov123-Isochrysis_galbana.AAC.2